LPGKGELQTVGPRLVTANTGLVARHLGKQFKRRPVLRDVTVSVQRGEAVGLLGPNGAGKTTCFYIITGLINADTGTIEMDGTDITHLPMYRRSRMGIGYLPQEASIFICAARRRWLCRAASAAASKSPARWRRARNSCCSTNRWPVSIRSRSAKYVN
jgi:ABC-type lipopolysaccharide export system ATPase subunit